MRTHLIPDDLEEVVNPTMHCAKPSMKTHLAASTNHQCTSSQT
jgi:hypothetical protein